MNLFQLHDCSQEGHLHDDHYNATTMTTCISPGFAQGKSNEEKYESNSQQIYTKTRRNPTARLKKLAADSK